MEDRHFVFESYCDGEMISMWTPLTIEQIEQIEKIVGVSGVIDDLTMENPLKIKEITVEQVIGSELNGASFEGFYTKPEQIKYLLENGIEDWKKALLKSMYPLCFDLAQNKTFEELDDMDLTEFAKEEIEKAKQ